MNELMIFNNPEFGEIRTVEIDGEPWFVAADVCRALEIGNPTQALTRLDNDEVTLISNEGGREVNFVNEPGLYSLVLGSRKPEAGGESIQALDYPRGHSLYPKDRRVCASERLPLRPPCSGRR